MADDFELITSEEVVLNNLQMYQQDKALIDMQIATAKRYPRNLKKAIENAITLVANDPEFADECTYSLKKGGKTIAGPSVNLAKMLIQQMGNIRAENRVVGYDATHVTCEAVCFDLERNLAIRTQIKRSIVGSSGRYSEDMQVIAGNAGNAIALRNAIFAVIDASIVKRVYREAKKAITGDVSDATKLIARRTTLFDSLKAQYPEFKLTDLEICQAVGKQAVAHITADDLVLLIGFENAIKNGENFLETVFRPRDVRTPVAQKVKAEDKSEERLTKLIQSAKDIPALEKLKSHVTSNEHRDAYDKQYSSLSAKSK